jgi:hypothetical protein
VIRTERPGGRVTLAATCKAERRNRLGQRGTTLQLGVEVANQSDQALAVGDFRAVLPIGGLRATAATVGTCGALPTGAPTSLTLAAARPNG